MTITLMNAGSALELPVDLIWTDEFTWSAVSQTVERSISGALIIDAMARNGGRSITLQGDGSSAWISLGTLRQLKAWAAVPGLQLMLTLRGDSFPVVFDHGDAEESRAVAMQAVVEYSDPEDSDYYCSLVLRFIEANV